MMCSVLDLLLRPKLHCVYSEEVIGLSWVDSGNIVESRGGDVFTNQVSSNTDHGRDENSWQQLTVGLSLTNQAVVLQNVLHLGGVDISLRLENALRLGPFRSFSIFTPKHAEIGDSDSLADFLVLECLAQCLGSSRGQLLSSTEHGASHNHHLATVAVVEAVLSLSGQNMSRHMSDILPNL